MDINVKRHATREKLIALIRELREETRAGNFATDPGYRDDIVADALNAVFRDSEVSDEELACFLAVCVGTWIQKHGGDPRLAVMVGEASGK